MEAEKLLPQQKKNMIAVTSGKNGVGKTWFSITLAHALSGFKQKTLFFDGDLGLGNIDVQLGLSLKDDLSSVLFNNKTLNQIINHNDKGHFDVIAGRSSLASLASMPTGRLQILGEDLSIISAAYDKVILDMGSGNHQSIRTLSGMSNKVIIVCTEEPSSLTDAYSFIKLMSTQHPKTELLIVVNQANSKQEGERTYDTLHRACQGFLSISPPLLGTIRRDTRVRDAIRNQTTLLARYPTSEAAEDVINIARKLI